MSSWRKCQWRPNALLKWCLGEIIIFDNICMKDWRWIVPQSFIVTVVVIWSPNVLNNSQVLLMMHQHLVRAMVWTGLFFGWCKYVKAYYTCKHFTYGRVLTHKRNFFSVFFPDSLSWSIFVSSLCHFEEPDWSTPWFQFNTKSSYDSDLDAHRFQVLYGGLWVRWFPFKIISQAEEILNTRITIDTKTVRQICFQILQCRCRLSLIIHAKKVLSFISSAFASKVFIQPFLQPVRGRGSPLFETLYKLLNTKIFWKYYLILGSASR